MLLLFDGDVVKGGDKPPLPLLKFSDVFEEFAIGDITYHDPIEGSKRLYADFTGDKYEEIWGTRVLSDNADNGYTLRGTDLNGALLYGIMFDQEGIPFNWEPLKEPDPVGSVSLTWVAYVFPYALPPKDGSPTASLPVTYKRKEGAGGGYQLVIEFFDNFRAGAGDPEANYDNFVDFADRNPVTVRSYMLNVYNETQHIYYENIQDALADNEPNPDDVINIPGGTYAGDINTDGLGGVTLYPGDSPACITVTGTFTVTDQDELIIDIEGTTECTEYTQLTIQGAIDLAGIDLIIQLGYLPDVDDEFLIINNESSVAVSNQFAQGTEITAMYDGYTVTFSITYDYADGSDEHVLLTVTGVEEPAAIPLANWALYLGFILMALFVAIRFRGRVL